MAIRRLRAEHKKLEKEIQNKQLVGFVVVPDEESLAWNVIMEGPQDSVYAEASYQLRLEFPGDYPFKPPRVNFKTKVWNPSISETGEICLNLLKQWKPSLYVSDLLRNLRSLLQEPSPDGAVNTKAAAEYKNDKEKFAQTVKHWKELYATKSSISSASET